MGFVGQNRAILLLKRCHFSIFVTFALFVRVILRNMPLLCSKKSSDFKTLMFKLILV